MKKYVVERDNPLQVYGKARIYVNKGTIHIFGKLFEEGVVIDVPTYRSYPVESSDSAQIEVEYSEKEPEYRPGVGTKIWSDRLSSFIRNPDNVLIIGRVDSGKTGLTKYLTNQLIYNGVSVNVIDLDPGQGDIGLPCFIGGASVKTPLIELGEVVSPKYRFIGTLSPMGNENALEEAANDLYLSLPKTDCTLFNLHGWITGYKAIKHIYRLVKLTGVNRIIYLADKYSDIYIRYVYNYLKLENPKIRLFRLPKPNVVRRSRVQRKRIREEKYADFIKRSDFLTKSVDLMSTLEINGHILTSKSIEADKIIRGFLMYFGLYKSPDMVVFNDMHIRLLYVSGAIRKPVQWVRKGVGGVPYTITILPERGHALLSALQTDNNHLPVFLYGFDLEKGIAKVKIPVDYLYYDLKRIRVGRTVINVETGEEVSFLRDWVF